MASDDTDDEMLDLFRTESREHLAELEQALMQLDQAPDDEEALAAAARQTHNLKGAARIMGFEGIETLAHVSEGVLQRGPHEGGLQAEEVAVLVDALDGLRALVDAATQGQPGAEDVPVEDLVAELEAAGEAGEPSVDEGAGGQPEGQDERGDEPGEGTRDPLGRARAHRIETIRVDPGQLDRLMRRASELTATVQRLDEGRRELARGQQLVAEIAQTIREEVVGETEPDVERKLRRTTKDLAERLDQMADRAENDTERLASLAEALSEGIQESRLLPMAEIFDLFSRAVRDLARDQGKQVELEIEGDRVRADKRVLEELKDPIMHLVRNAVDHGIEPPEERREQGKDPVARVRLAARRTAHSLVVEVEDDGRGIDPDEVREVARRRGAIPEVDRLDDEAVIDLVFDAGFTTREAPGEVSGRGIGLGTVARGVDELRGTVDVSSTLNEGTLVRIEVPVALSTARVMLVCLGEHRFAVPTDALLRVLNVALEDVDHHGEVTTVEMDGQPVPVADIAEALEVDSPARAPFASGESPCVVLLDRGERVGLLVDDLVGETEIVVEPLGAILGSVRMVAGATVLSDGAVCVILDPREMADAIREAGPLELPSAEPQPSAEPRLLLVEDTDVTRRQIRRGLETAGFSVLEAPDGEEGWARLRDEDVDAVVTDVLMPEVDGIELTERIRASAMDVPIVLVTTSERSGPARQALEAGADAYMPKKEFDPARLADTIEELIA
ncbi:hypothetical protein BRD56_03370 [Thermoplasmatales archaeon SW_10_69_26]|nr:MAG: hypothetical protein BRD56_03370 [Thermoplasmatales archaeon SW_10_69_26]